jgi:hypothetical protein
LPTFFLVSQLLTALGRFSYCFLSDWALCDWTWSDWISDWTLCVWTLSECTLSDCILSDWTLSDWTFFRFVELCFALFDYIDICRTLLLRS